MIIGLGVFFIVDAKKGKSKWKEVLE
jgi:hypothetical protein